MEEDYRDAMAREDRLTELENELNDSKSAFSEGLSCPQCGEETETLNEGYCEECRKENQKNLDEHNASFDRWESMSETERNAEIKAAR